MKLSTTNIIMIVQSALILILFIVVVLKPTNQINESKVEYERIKKDTEAAIGSLKSEIKIIQDETQLVLFKVDSMKAELPKHEKNLSRINRNLKQLNDAYVNRNYSDSSASSLLDRISR